MPKSRDEILKNGGPDIGIAGLQSKKYGAIYKQYTAGKTTREQAEKQIAQVYGTGETDSVSHANYRQLYSDRYAEIWDAKFPGKPKTFRAP